MPDVTIQTLFGPVVVPPDQQAGETDHFIIHHPSFTELDNNNRPLSTKFDNFGGYYNVTHKPTGHAVGTLFYNADLAMSAAQALENLPIDWDCQDIQEFRKRRMPRAKIRDTIQHRGGSYETNAQFIDRMKARGIITPEMAMA